MVFNTRLYSLLFVLFFISYSISFSQNQMRGPVRKIKKIENEEYGKGENTFLNFYQEWISPVKGGNLCPMHPSCSQYSKIAFAKYSSFKALTMTCDRLLRCGHEQLFYKEIIIGNRIKFYDPVLEN